MTTKDDLHQIVDQLPASKLEAAARLYRLIGRLPDNEVPRIEEVLEQACAGVEIGQGMTAEDRAWLESDLSRLSEFEPYDWGDAGPPIGQPVRYEPGRGPVVVLESDAEDAREQ